MLIVPARKYRRTRREVNEPAAAPAPPPGVPLVLQSASYESFGPQIVLTFDREVDVTGLVGSAIQVSDGSFNSLLYEVSGPVEVLGGGEILCPLQAIGAVAEGDVVMNAAAGNGIVAVDDGGLWAGMMNVELPYSAP